MMHGHDTRGTMTDDDLIVLIGVVAHLEAMLLDDDVDPTEIVPSMLNRLRQDFLRRGLSTTDTREAHRESLRRLNMRLRRSLGEDLPPHTRL
ncbi:hypothetical protein [Dactylosporangium sp. NPDC051484]|uniref:hypothetical protein n=1 Tax=Dactylosporangium sp. NPDC051484 TaxID=3154942 RepID=UPI00344C68C1